MLILVINPGSTSTKIAIYDDEKMVFKRNISHSPEQLAPYNDVIEQFEFRKQLIMDVLKEENYNINDFKAIIGRGGLTKPIPGGVYEVNDLMVNDARNAVQKHASNLGCIIAKAIADEVPGCRSFIADPVVVDELNDLARVCGSPLIKRHSIWHALNQKAIARRYARENGKRYEDLNLIVCHLGGGISVASHEKGMAVDVNNALDGEGPFSPERAGTIPAADLVKLCFSGQYTQQQVIKMLNGKGGVTALMGINDMRELERLVAEEHDPKATLVTDAMIYHVSKEIASQSAVLCGKVDAIILTGGIAYWKYVVEEITRRVGFIAPVVAYPGEDEMQALAFNALSAIRGEVEAKQYK
ncbi:MAG: butyrate kinase [Bacteroidales bacterium]|nr:butyrate kinase [Candidatus Sodaliphilus aphodohippi]